MRLPKFTLNSQGIILTELLIALGIFVIAVSTVAFLIIDAYRADERGRELTIATFLANEGLEAVRSIRDNNWQDLTAGEHGLATSSNHWIFFGSQDNISNLLKEGIRKIIVENIDTNRRRVVSQVSWRTSEIPSRSISTTVYLTNWRASSIGNWALPSIETSFDLTTANSGNSAANAMAIAFANNYLYLGRANSAGREFYIFDVSNPASPTLLGQRDLDGDPNDIIIFGNYAYIASTDNSSELQIVDVSDPSTVDQSGKLTVVDLTVSNSGNNNANAQALAADGDYLYMIRNGGDEFLIFDLSNPSNPGYAIGRSSVLTGTLNDLAVSGDYAFAVSTDNSAELQVMNVTNKTAPSLATTLNLDSGNNNANALTLDIGNNYLFIGRASSAAPELYSIDVSAPSSPALAATLEIGNDITNLAYNADTGYVFLATVNTSYNFQVVDASNPASLPPPPPLGRLNITNSPNMLTYDLTLDRIFVASTADSQEVQTIRPQ